MKVKNKEIKVQKSIYHFRYFAASVCLHFAQVWDLVAAHDIGCTPGGGKDAMGVFYDAGLLFMSDKGTATTERQGETSSPKF